MSDTYTWHRLLKIGHACGPSSAVARSTDAADLTGPSGNSTWTVSKNNGLYAVALTIHGSNFGRDGDIGAKLSVELVCEPFSKNCGRPGSSLKLDATTMRREQNRIRINFSPGLGQNLRVKVTVSDQSNDASTYSHSLSHVLLQFCPTQVIKSCRWHHFGTG